ncbi:patatin-like phospholipase family protein [Phorcysia thermohydrogeniphila]|uniref:NTE family protein n=1 Tax=Phorcysia thermohydrogeniphila TaxID=936138 RepID=A0A4R1G6R1_9BACT|nr:patatin-like phospholipase family protein [Phorcysia thermohydrogeniphila]TCK03394.1 NTE family protein [Phorcysia thermohydrogeniphila]
MKVGVTLSGGFVKGVAHAGFLKALEFKGISPSFVAGTSTGALIGVLYCAGYSPDEIKEIALSLSWKNIVRPSLKGGLFSLAGLRKKLLDLIGDLSFSELKIPLGLTVVNLKTLKVEFVTEGKVVDYVVASCSIPPLFSPYRVGSDYYIDGGIRNSMPAEMVKAYGCKINICSNVNVARREFNHESLVDVTVRAILASVLENQERRCGYCDIFVDHDIEGSMFDFARVADFFEQGFKNGLSALESSGVLP